MVFVGAFVCENIKFHSKISSFKINQSRYIALSVVSRSIKKLFSIDYVNIYFFSIFFFNRFLIEFFSRENCGVNLHCLYRDSLTLRYYKYKIIQYLKKINYLKKHNAHKAQDFHNISSIKTTNTQIILLNNNCSSALLLNLIVF